MCATHVPWRQKLEEGLNYQRGGELDRALESYLTVADGADDPALVSEALRHQSDVYRMRAEWQEAIDVARRAAEIAELAGLSELRADAMNTEASTHFYIGDFDIAVPLLNQVLELASGERVRGAALMNLGSIAARSGDLQTAVQRFTEAHGYYERAGYLRGQVLALQNSGCVALDREDYDQAVGMLQQAVAAARKVNDLDLLAMTNVNYAEALAGKHEYARATDCASTAIGYFTIVDNKIWRVKSLRLMGDLYVKQNDRITARRCYERGARLAQEIDAKMDADRIAERLEALDAQE